MQLFLFIWYYTTQREWEKDMFPSKLLILLMSFSVSKCLSVKSAAEQFGWRENQQTLPWQWKHFGFRNQHGTRSGHKQKEKTPQSSAAGSLETFTIAKPFLNVRG